MLRMSSPSQVDNEVVFCCTTIFRISTSTSVLLSDWCHYGKMPILQHISATKIRSIKICTIPQLSSYSERCNARSIRDTHLKADILLIILPRIIRFSFKQQMILIKTFWLFFYGKSQSENFGAMLQRVRPGNSRMQANDKRGIRQKTIRTSEESKVSEGRRISDISKRTWKIP